jgi:hypothetical protein
MNITIFKTGFIDNLQNSIQSNIERYTETEVWADKIGDPDAQEINTSLKYRTDSIDLLLPDEGGHKDVENAIRIHKALPDLTRLNARDPRLWTRLSHVELYNYMVKRWSVSNYKGIKDKDLGKVDSFIKVRYFVAQSQSRALMRNGIARLWWAAHLTHDKAKSNPYELTAVLFSTLDIAQTILERNMGRSSVILISFLEFLLENNSLLLSGGDLNRQRIRNLAKSLNMQGGICVLDCLQKNYLKDLLRKSLQDQLLTEAT